MSAFDKEKIFDELRNYHATSFPAKASSEEMKNLRTRFEEIQDNIINMVLSFINGKTEFIDASKELNAFGEKVKIDPNGNRSEDKERNIFAQKIGQLTEVLATAKASTFRLRTPARVK